MLYQANFSPSCPQKPPPCVSFVAESTSATTPSQDSLIPRGACSIPKAFAPKLPISVWTQLQHSMISTTFATEQGWMGSHPGEITKAVRYSSSVFIFLVSQCTAVFDGEYAAFVMGTWFLSTLLVLHRATKAMGTSDVCLL